MPYFKTFEIKIIVKILLFFNGLSVILNLKAHSFIQLFILSIDII